MLYIHLTRHGETEWNQEKRLQGALDSPLTEKGVRDATSLGKRMYETELAAIYTSPMQRAVHTAELVRSERAIPIVLAEDLREMSFGEWEGKTRPEIEEHFAQEYANFWEAPHRYNHEPHQAESLAVFRKRVEQGMKEILSKHTHGNIAIVAHAVVIRAILAYVRQLPTEMLWEPPFIHGASLTVISWDGNEFKLELLGDTTHIEE